MMGMAGQSWEADGRLTRRRLVRGVLAGIPALLLPACLRNARAESAEILMFDGLYKRFGVLGYEFAERVQSLAGKTVLIPGYMAPPLKTESSFFVLTREPLAICPFCQSDADWPVDILVVYLAKTSPLVTAGAKLMVTGRLEIGPWTDPDTKFMSQIRLRDAAYRRA